MTKNNQDPPLQQLCGLRDEVRKSKRFKGRAALLKKLGQQIRFMGKFKVEDELAEKFLTESTALFNSQTTGEGQVQVGMF